MRPRPSTRASGARRRLNAIHGLFKVAERVYQVRGLLKNLGLVIGRATFNVFSARAGELIEDRPDLVAAIGPLLEARKAIEQQVRDLDRKVLKLARYDVQVRRFMTAPGVGPITALCFKATIDDPTRFRRSRSVGAYVGLTTRRHALCVDPMAAPHPRPLGVLHPELPRIRPARVPRYPLQTILR